MVARRWIGCEWVLWGVSVTNADALEQSAIQGRRFLVIDSNKDNLEKLERYLLIDAAAKVYKAKAPLVALRILQDRRTPVDCVICAQNMSPITGLDFLQNLRTGRYGGKSLRETDVILTMPQMEDSVVIAAESFLVSGFIYGELTRDSVSEAVNKALSLDREKEASEVCRIAHVRQSGIDLILVPFESDFGDLPSEEQETALAAIQKTAVLAGLKGEVVPIWPTREGNTSFIAPKSCHQVVKKLTFDFVKINLNRQFTPVGFPESAKAALPPDEKKKKTTF